MSFLFFPPLRGLLLATLSDILKVSSVDCFWHIKCKAFAVIDVDIVLSNSVSS